MLWHHPFPIMYIRLKTLPLHNDKWALNFLLFHILTTTTRQMASRHYGRIDAAFAVLSASVLGWLKVLVVQLFLGFVKLAKLFDLSLAKLLPFCIMCRETLCIKKDKYTVNNFKHFEFQYVQEKEGTMALPCHQSWSTCPFLSGTSH